MVTATFTFRPLRTNADFESLNERIDAIAASSKGYLGRTRWENGDGDISVVYYWANLEDLETFRRDSTHNMAKSRVSEWYAGYRVEVSSILEVYGDGFFDEKYPKFPAK